jgi:hypothetical protein
MRRLIIIAFLFMNLSLPMGTQASNGGNVSPDPNFQIYLCFGQSNMEGNAAIEERTLLGSERLMLHRSSSQNGRKWLEMRIIKNNVHFYKEKLANMDEIVYFCK